MWLLYSLVHLQQMVLDLGSGMFPCVTSHKFCSMSNLQQSIYSLSLSYFVEQKFMRNPLPLSVVNKVVCQHFTPSSWLLLLFICCPGCITSWSFSTTPSTSLFYMWPSWQTFSRWKSFIIYSLHLNPSILLPKFLSSTWLVPISAFFVVPAGRTYEFGECILLRDEGCRLLWYWLGG